MKLIKLLNFAPFILFSIVLRAQPNYIDTSYQYSVTKSLKYAVDTNYAGNLVDLTLDLYKPINDNTTKRPVIVIVHGGYWTAGTSKDAEIAALSKYFVKRGFVVASINYRLGWHLATNVANPFGKNPFVNPDYNPSQCTYPYDTSELVRANYRGMQDVKSAIRWLKARWQNDSTCGNSYYVAGASAGGFIAYATALLDRVSEKPIHTKALADAAAPSNNLLFCENLNNLPSSPRSRKRYDLGSIDGNTNLNGYNCKVKGVISIFGGWFDFYPSQSIIQGADTPFVYMYHQECDLVVPFNRYTGNGYLFDYCNALGYTRVSTFPIVRGSNNIVQYLKANNVKNIKTSFVKNGAPTGFSCLLDPPCHSMPFAYSYSDTIARYIKQFVLRDISACNNSLINNLTIKDIKVYPNPTNNELNIEFNTEIITPIISIYDLKGKEIYKQILASNYSFLIPNISKFVAGIYILKIEYENNIQYLNIIKN